MGKVHKNENLRQVFANILIIENFNISMEFCKLARQRIFFCLPQKYECEFDFLLHIHRTKFRSCCICICVCCCICIYICTDTDTCIFIGPRYTWGPIYGSRVSLTNWQTLWKLIQVIQVIQVIDSIQRRWPEWCHPRGNFATYASDSTWWLMQMAPSGGQIWKLCKRRHLVDNFETNANCAIWWSNL